jgi:hypothetical protein
MIQSDLNLNLNFIIILNKTKLICKWEVIHPRPMRKPLLPREPKVNLLPKRWQESKNNKLTLVYRGK